MLAKIKALWNVLQKGKEVADPENWKKRQVTSTLLGGAIIAVVQLAKAFDYDLQIDEDTVTAIAGGIIAFVNWIGTLATTTKVGIGKAPIEDHSYSTIDKVPED